MNLIIMHDTYIIRMVICSIVLIVLQIIKNVHIIQLNSYNLDQQIVWYKKNWAVFIVNIITLIAVVLFYKFAFLPMYILLVISLLALFVEHIPRKQKKRLVYTDRVKRLIFICLLLSALFYIPLIINRTRDNVFYIMLAASIAPIIIFVGYFITLPIENALRKKYMIEAKKIIDESKSLYTIGITGSFGKTSVKYYLYTLLNSKYNTCMTPESFNTAMGATLTIKNDLKSYDDIFLCEMGARRIGDVKEICDVVSPRGAILTDVGNMHLDTFLNIKNVRKCKFELIDSVYSRHISGENGTIDGIKKNIVLVNGDNELIMEKIKEYSFEKGSLYTYGMSDSNDFYASNLFASSSGTSFDIVCSIKGEKKTYNIETKLLGLNNIKNLTGAIAYAMLLDCDINDIINSAKRIDSVSHRLQLITADKENLIIDDAYNSNPMGARNAIDTVASFNDYIKIVITPGMVELGDRQDSENESFAKYAGERVDYVFVVGKTNKESLMKGLKNSISDDKRMYFDKVEEAMVYARNKVSGKKVILLENDLSDNY